MDTLAEREQLAKVWTSSHEYLARLVATIFVRGSNAASAIPDSTVCLMSFFFLLVRNEGSIPECKADAPSHRTTVERVKVFLLHLTYGELSTQATHKHPTTLTRTQAVLQPSWARRLMLGELRTLLPHLTPQLVSGGHVTEHLETLHTLLLAQNTDTQLMAYSLLYVVCEPATHTSLCTHPSASLMCVAHDMIVSFFAG